MNQPGFHTSRTTADLLPHRFSPISWEPNVCMKTPQHKPTGFEGKESQGRWGVSNWLCWAWKLRENYGKCQANPEKRTYILNQLHIKYKCTIKTIIRREKHALICPKKGICCTGRTSTLIGNASIRLDGLHLKKMPENPGPCSICPLRIGFLGKRSAPHSFSMKVAVKESCFFEASLTTCCW